MLSFRCTALATLRVMLTVLLVACGATEPDTAAFTMAAVVNAGPWGPGGGDVPPPTATFNQTDHSLTISGTQVGVLPRTRGIGIDVKNVSGPGTYPLGDAAGGGSSAIYSETTGTIGGGDFNFTLYSTSAARTGTLVITALDLSNRTISGTFSFDAVNGQGAIVSVTQGTFSGRLATS